MASYRLNDEAGDDLDRLYTDGILNFGLYQADMYYDGIVLRLQEIADKPYHWQAVDNVKEGYRRSVYRSHAIYYKISNDFDDMVEIMRILKHEDLNCL